MELFLFVLQSLTAMRELRKQKIVWQMVTYSVLRQTTIPYVIKE